MEFSGQEFWSGYPFPSPGDLPDQGTEHMSLALQADSLPSEAQGEPKEFLKVWEYTRRNSDSAGLGSDPSTRVF